MYTAAPAQAAPCPMAGSMTPACSDCVQQEVRNATAQGRVVNVGDACYGGIPASDAHYPQCAKYTLPTDRSSCIDRVLAGQEP